MQTMPRWLFLIQVSRPIVWPVLPLVYLLGLNAADGNVSAVAVLQMLLLTFPMNLVGCGLNDVYDIESDRRSGRRRAIWAAVVRDEDRPLVWRACWWMVPLVVAGAIATLNVYNAAAACTHLAIAAAYSVPPVRLKERPPLDSLANGLGYFLLPFVMGYSLGANPAAMPVKYYLLALAVCGIHAIATAADYDADRAAGHRTLAVAFGRRAANAIAMSTFAVAWWFGDYRSTAVNVFLVVGVVATSIASLMPRDRVIAAACVTIFVGFLVAAICHLAGI
jgi:4-hydroxybenzoate polyprenyltransferase